MRRHLLMVLAGLWGLGTAWAVILAPPAILTREMDGLRGPVTTVREVTGPGEYQDGQWVCRYTVLTTLTEYDAAGRLLRRETQLPQETQITRYAYDDAGRVRFFAREYTYPSHADVRATPQSYTYRYDARGGLDEILETATLPPLPSPSGERAVPRLAVTVTRFTHDAAGRLQQAEVRGDNGALQATVRWRYDAAGRERSRVTTNAEGVETQRRTVTYADGGSTIEEVSADAKGLVYLRTTEQLDALGHRREYTEVQRRNETTESHIRETVTYRLTGGREVRRETADYFNGKAHPSTVTTAYYDDKDRCWLQLNAREAGPYSAQSSVYSRSDLPTASLTAGDRQSSLPTLTSYTHDTQGNWTVKVTFIPQADAEGTPLVAHGAFQGQWTITLREITYAEGAPQ